MKHLQRGLVASAAGLLLTVGLATGASAAATDCKVSVNDTSVVEGNTGTTPLTFTVTATAPASTPAACDNVMVDYAFSNGTGTSPTDYTAPANNTITFAGAETQTLTATVNGDTTIEPDETFKVTLTLNSAGVTLTKAVGTGTIQTDDTIGPNGTATISPTSGPSGTTITVTGTKCNETKGSAALVEVKGESGGPLVEDTNRPVAADGTFTATLVVPANADPSATQFVRAYCGANNNQAYADASFDVTPARGGGHSDGYRMVASDGGVFVFGDRGFVGSLGDRRLNKPIVGGATNPATFDGYWMVASDGGVFNFGDAGFFGSLGDKALTSPIVEIEPTPSGKGYFLVDAKGQVTPFGDAAKNIPDARSIALNKSIIGMTVTSSGQGYWLVASDGGIFNFGDAKFFGSTGDRALNAPVIDLARTPDDGGYYLVASDGGVFTFGNADFKGSAGNIKLNKPAVAMLVNPTGSGYWIMASDGGVFTYGAVPFLGSTGNIALNSPILDAID